MIHTTQTCNEVLHTYIMYIRWTNYKYLAVKFKATKHLLQKRNSKNYKIAYNTILYNNNSTTTYIHNYQKYNCLNV